MDTNQWFVETYNGSALMIRVKNTLFDHRGIQHIQIFETESFGKMLVLDGKVQLTERDETFYHEMLVHVPLFTIDNPEKILVIGGGDGGTVREILKHNPSEVLMIEIDRDVVDACRKYIGVDRGSLDDERVTVLFEDGIEFVRNSNERFDAVIVDGTDPNPVSKSLIEEEFYKSCSRITKKIFSTQSQSPFAQGDYLREMLSNIKDAFPHVSIYINFVPTYPSGLWSYIIASNSDIKVDMDVLVKRWEERQINTVHYNPEIHYASFMLPQWLKESVKEILH